MSNNYPIKATFIDSVTYDIPSNNYSREQWSKELDYMKDVGINTLVFIRAYFYNQCLYPSTKFKSLIEPVDDLPKIIFEEAEKRDMKVFMGLYIKDIDWNRGDADHEIKMNKIIIDEIVERYGKYKSFYGWYIPHEVGTNILRITDIFKELSRMCKEKTPDKKILISPFFHTYILGVPKEESLSPDDVYNEWIDIFSHSGNQIDYCAFQDTSAPIPEIPEYYKAAKKACDQFGIELWANIELLTRNTKDFYPISLDLLKYKIDAAKPYVKSYMVFEFSHFMSPQSMFNSAGNLYNLYKDFYK